MKKVKYICTLCNLEQEIQLSSFRRKKTLFCNKCASTGTQGGIKRPNYCRENSKRWKGGEYISSDGYRMVKVENEYHASGRQLYKPEHILIYEQFLERKLKTGVSGKGEQIHHADGNKLNNSIDNLIYCSGRREHRLLHCQLEEISFELVRLNLIKFDKETNKYFINKGLINASKINN